MKSKRAALTFHAVLTLLFCSCIFSTSSVPIRGKISRLEKIAEDSSKATYRATFSVQNGLDSCCVGLNVKTCYPGPSPQRCAIQIEVLRNMGDFCGVSSRKHYRGNFSDTISFATYKQHRGLDSIQLRMYNHREKVYEVGEWMAVQ